MLEPVVATLDVVRKIEMLKERAVHIEDGEWKSALTKFCSKLESVSRQRNIACHAPPVLVDGLWTFKSIAAAKILKALGQKSDASRAVGTVADFKSAIEIGESAFGLGIDLETNFNRLNAEKDRRSAASEGGSCA